VTPAAGAIPDDLKELDQWVLWRREERNGKQTKVPCQPNGKLASSTDSKTWRSFSEICAAWQQKPKKFAGIGFVFTSDDPLSGIDMDDCLDSGVLKPCARLVVERFHDTYSEVSPSGKGIKIFAKGKLPGGGKRKDFGDHAIEMYDQGRFFTITGQIFNGAPLQIEDHQSDIE
jgi:putative DNA primase/helicase